MSHPSAAAESDELAELCALSSFDGDPPEFWRRYVQGLAAVCGAHTGLVAIRRPDGHWGTVARWPRDQTIIGPTDQATFDVWAALSASEPQWVEVPGPQQPPARRLVAVVPGPPNGPVGLIVLALPENPSARNDEARVRLTLGLVLPGHFEDRRLLDAAKQDTARLASALDLMAMLNGQTRFVSAAMTLCNEIAARFSCDRAALGWLEANAITVRALSHTERIEPKMEAVQQLASAMEEALDQEEEIVHPRPAGQAFVTYSHEAYAKAQAATHLATLPIFQPFASDQLPGETPRPVAALTLERTARSFTLDELRTLRLILDQAARPLADLHRSDRWFAARWLASARHTAGKWLGAEHTWWKLLALAAALGLLVLILGRKDYSVEGSFTVKTDAMAHLAAPFEGHIERVLFQPGDSVTAGQTLVALDPRELLLQKEAAVAERGRHAADALKAESSGDVAGMRIAQARENQARVQTELVDDRLARAGMKAPFDGVIVEGDLREKIAAPVQKGDLLLKLARIEDLYLIVEVPENDIQDIRVGATGRAAFASQPARKFTFTVDRIEPVARSKEKGGVFALRCRFSEAAPDWWRPGMSGVARISAGRRNLFWIYTHRSADFLRMWWW